ncbi:glycosyltransferase family 2 protein [Myxococcota bacterium]|nr:glycosyltransferase family 2 protein [Myxococcota bacterium]
MVALIPARNEGPRVGAVVRAALARVNRVVVVVNGTTDDTAERAQEAGAEVIFSEPGYARALARGYDHLRGQALVQLDADGQHPPEAIPALIAGLDRADLVIGSRWLGEPGYAVPPLRRLGMRALSAWLQGLTGLRVRDTTSGLMALSPRAVSFFATSFPEEIADTNVLARAWRAGLVIAELPVPMRDRAGGVGLHGGLRGVTHGLRVLKLTWTEARGAPPPVKFY